MDPLAPGFDSSMSGSLHSEYFKIERERRILSYTVGYSGFTTQFIQKFQSSVTLSADCGSALQK